MTDRLPLVLAWVVWALPFFLIVTACGEAREEPQGLSSRVASLVCEEAFECSRCAGGVTFAIVEPYAAGALFGGATSETACAQFVEDELVRRMEAAIGEGRIYDPGAAFECAAALEALPLGDGACRCHVDLDMGGARWCAGVLRAP